MSKIRIKSTIFGDETEKEIVEVFRKGYIINDRVIRHSMVKVAN